MITHHLQYTTGLAVYFSHVGAYILRHIVPISLSDIMGAVAPANIESMLAKGDGMVRIALHFLHFLSMLCTQSSYYEVITEDIAICNFY